MVEAIQRISVIWFFLSPSSNLVCFISGVYSVLVYFYLFPLSILVSNSTHVHGSKVPLSHIHTHQMRFKAIFILLLGLHTVHSFTIKFWIISTVAVHSSIRFAEFFHWMYNLVRWICEKAIQTRWNEFAFGISTTNWNKFRLFPREITIR